jgi:YebC/PmpR family DNA-binding regulatory protein
MSGHSKWSTIKRKKAAEDAKRGQLFTRLAREIAVAAREGGGDPEVNFTLRLAIERAKQNNMPKDNIERAIRRGTGEDKDAADLEQVMYEGYAPNGVALMIEVITDNRNRTVAQLRHDLSEAGGNLADAGSVAWQFRRAAYFAFPAEGHDEDEIFELAVEAGAEDVTFGEDIEITASIEDFKAVSDRLEQAGIKPEEARLRMVPKALIELPIDQTVRVMRLIDRLEEEDDVQRIYANLEVSDTAVEQLEAA